MEGPLLILEHACPGLKSRSHLLQGAWGQGEGFVGGVPDVQADETCSGDPAGADPLHSLPCGGVAAAGADPRGKQAGPEVWESADRAACAGGRQKSTCRHGRC